MRFNGTNNDRGIVRLFLQAGQSCYIYCSLRLPSPAFAKQCTFSPNSRCMADIDAWRFYRHIATYTACRQNLHRLLRTTQCITEQQTHLSGRDSRAIGTVVYWTPPAPAPPRLINLCITLLFLHSKSFPSRGPIKYCTHRMP